MVFASIWPPQVLLPPHGTDDETHDADPEYGGNSFKVRDQLRNVEGIQATEFAFAAILAEGSVVTWGDEDNGRDSTQVADQIANL